MQAINSVGDALGLCKKSIIAIGVFSFVINFLSLTPLFYMMNVFDKAVSTLSFPTLYSLIIIALFLYLLLAGFEWVRSLLMIHVANKLDLYLAPRLYQLCFLAESGLISAKNMGSQPLSDLNAFRQFMGSPTAAVIFDLPWTPIFLVLMFFFHPSLALIAVICLLIVTVLAILNQRGSTRALSEANLQAQNIRSATEKNLRNAEAAAAMGMMTALSARWRAKQDAMLAVQMEGSSVASAYTSGMKTLTMLLQSVAITAGAALVMMQEISPGTMIAAALLLGKCIQPAQQAVTSWKSFIDARDQYQRLNDVLSQFPPEEPKMELPSLQGNIASRSALVIPPGADKPALADISLDFLPGSTNVILGPSGAGKSTLIRTILGIWPTTQGEMRIDGVRSADFDRDVLGPQIGYLPQAIELLDGTVAENIARFGNIDPALVYQAAEDAGVRDLILALPQGFDTMLAGASNGILSPGNKQRIALARAVYGRPKVIVLDEPNSNLDANGEAALASCVSKMKAGGSTVIIVSHRPSVLELADFVTIIDKGRVRVTGPKDQVLASLSSEQSPTLADA